MAQNVINAKPATYEEALASTEDIFRKGTLLRFRISKWGQTARVPTGSVNKTDANNEWLGAKKRKVAKGAMASITGLMSEARQFVRSHSLPWGMEFPGMTFVSHANVSKVEAALLNTQKKIEAAAADLAPAWPEIIETAKANLGVLFNASDYPDAKNLAQEFSLRWEWIIVSPPDASIADIDAQLYDAQKSKFMANLREARDGMVAAFREEFMTMLTNATTRLTAKNADGTPKAVKSSAVTQFVEFFETFDGRNVFHDDELAALVQKAKGLVQGTEIKDINSDDSLKESLATEFGKVTIALESVIAKAKRKIEA